MSLVSFLPPDGECPGKAAIAAHGGSVTYVTVADGMRLRTASFAPHPDWLGQPAAESAPVLFLNGRSDFIEKNLEAIDALRRRGHHVWTLDWRGQGRSGRMLPDPVRGYVPTFDLFLSDLERVVESQILPALNGRRLVLLAHSMGGNVGLRYLARRRPLFEAAIFSAPLIGIQLPSAPPGVARLLVLLSCKLLRRAGAYAPGHGPATPGERGFETNKLTTCRERFERLDSWLVREQELHVGGVTWGWLRAALDSVDALQMPDLAEALDLPIMVLLAEEEAVVDNRAALTFLERLPQGRAIMIEHARHELLLEADGPRRHVWEAIDEFLATQVHETALPDGERAAYA